MKKKILYSILICLGGILLSGIKDVNAKEMKDTEIENGSYVIGTYLFTKDYPTVSTKEYMLAAKSIASGELSDMIIYYKDLNGIWIDASTGDSLIVPDVFNITEIDMNEVLEEETPEDEIKEAINLDGIAGFNIKDNISEEEYFEESTYKNYKDAVHDGLDEVYGEGEVYLSIEEHIVLIKDKKERLLSKSSFLSLSELLLKLEEVSEEDYVGLEEDFLYLLQIKPVYKKEHLEVKYLSEKELCLRVKAVEDLLNKFTLKEENSEIEEKKEITDDDQEIVISNDETSSLTNSDNDLEFDLTIDNTMSENKAPILNLPNDKTISDTFSVIEDMKIE